MGTFTTVIRIEGPTGRSRSVEALIDTGATHTLLPGDVLRDLGVEPLERVSFRLADERTVEYPVGEVRIRLDGRERMTVVIFGPEGATPLLGATTLELFNLAVDPVGKRLVPVPGLLKKCSTV
jgi:clan AA aspartic protease